MTPFKCLSLILELSEFISWPQKVFKAAIYLHFCSLGRVDISSLLMVSGNKGMMRVGQNGAILHDSGL